MCEKTGYCFVISEKQKVVFIVGAEEKIFPITRAYDSTSEMEEERRLMYVAITRAKEKLFITSSRTRFIYGKRDYNGEGRGTSCIYAR